MDVFIALAEPIRRDLLQVLAGGAARVVDLSAAHPVSRPAISRHLRILRDAGLVRATDRGRERHYELDPRPLAEVQGLIEQLAPRRPLVSDRNLDALETETRRTARDRRTTSKKPATEKRTDKERTA